MGWWCSRKLLWLSQPSVGCCLYLALVKVVKNGLSDTSFKKYMRVVQDEVSNFFATEWGNEGTADLLDGLSNLFTLTSSRCLLGEEIRARWKDSGMAKHYFALDHSFVPILFSNLPKLPGSNLQFATNTHMPWTWLSSIRRCLSIQRESISLSKTLKQSSIHWRVKNGIGCSHWRVCPLCVCVRVERCSPGAGGVFVSGGFMPQTNTAFPLSTIISSLVTFQFSCDFGC